MNGRRLWTEREIDILKKLYPHPEIPISEIARALNRTVRAVNCKAADLGIKRGYKDFIDEKLVEQLYRRVNLKVENGQIKR